MFLATTYTTDRNDDDYIAAGIIAQSPETLSDNDLDNFAKKVVDEITDSIHNDEGNTTVTAQIDLSWVDLEVGDSNEYRNTDDILSAIRTGIINFLTGKENALTCVSIQNTEYEDVFTLHRVQIT